MEAMLAGVQLQLAARNGDVEYLIEAVENLPIEYFLSTHIKAISNEETFNFIQNAILWEQLEFLKQAVERLPPLVLLQLLSHKHSTFLNYNSFHCLALRGNPEAAKLLVDFFKTLPSPSTDSSSSSENLFDSKPWLEVGTNGMTPLQLALKERKEECAIELMEMDLDLLSNMVDNQGFSPLTEAVRLGCSEVALKILKSGLSYSTSGASQLTPLDVAPNCSEEVCRLLLQKHPEMVKKIDEGGYTLLHNWIILGKLWPFELLFEREDTSAWRRDFIDLMCATVKATGNTPLHQAAYSQGDEIVQVVKFLVEAYQDAYEKEKGSIIRTSPWKRENNAGPTPLIMAIIGRLEGLALYLLSVDLQNSIAKGALFHAVHHGCDLVVEKILTSVPESALTYVPHVSENGQNILHVAYKCTERIGNLLVEKLPWQMNEADENGKKPLDIASENNTAWLIESLLRKDPLSIQQSPSAWIEACKRGHLSAIHAFIAHCPDFRTLCLEQCDTPLHHIQLKTFREYQEFLAIPLISRMKNIADSYGATPLHRAIARNDIFFAEALLATNEIDTSIKDKNGKSAMDLLQALKSEEWKGMCKRNGINTEINTHYVKHIMNTGGGNTASGNGLSAGEIRGTLSVVAALLATLTFAAGFTLPGGVNQETGEALLAKKASFLVFILADTYAMCCSMVVLFCLIWSMVSDKDKSVLLIDRSVVILMQSLYGTLLAFMTGVFTVISRKSLWASILVFVMCSLVAISANRTVLYKILDKLVPAANQETTKTQTRSLEEGTTDVSAEKDNVENDDYPLLNV